MGKKTIVNSIFKPFVFCAVLLVLGLLMNSRIALAADKPAAPKFSVKAGTYYVSSYKSVKISCSTDGAKIFYSTDGETYSEYTKAVKIKQTSTLYAYSSLNGVKSDVVSRKYKLKVRLSGVTPNAGEYDSAQTVKITTKATNVKIYYTLDGSKPTTKSAKYTSDGITIAQSGSLRLLIKKTGFTSRYTTKKYVINSSGIGNTETGDTDAGNTEAGNTGSNPADVISKVNMPASGMISEYVFAEGDGYDIYGKKFADRIYYSLINSSEKKAYELIYKACLRHNSSVNISSAGLSSKNAFKIFNYVISESPELFWVNDGNISSSGEPVVYLYLEYSNTLSEENTRFPKLEAAAEKIVAEALKKEDLYDTVMYMHDWIVDKAVYNNNNSSSRDLAGTDDIILDGTGLCTAYARAFMYLCHKAGIDCVMVNGTANNGYGIEDHSWNKLKLDGKWYAMDVTWDDPVYAAGTDLSLISRTYTYFCLSDAEMGNDHTLSGDFKFTALACNSNEYSYATRNRIQEFSSVAEAFNFLSDNVDRNYLDGKKKTEICCADYNMATSLFEYLMSNGINSRHAYTYGYSGKYVYIEVTD